MHRIVISKYTNSVYKDGFSITGLTLSIPEDVSSLYLDDDSTGWIENTNGSITTITSLPSWAVDCIGVFEYEKAEMEKEKPN